MACRPTYYWRETRPLSSRFAVRIWPVIIRPSAVCRPSNNLSNVYTPRISPPTDRPTSAQNSNCKVVNHSPGSAVTVVVLRQSVRVVQSPAGGEFRLKERVVDEFSRRVNAIKFSAPTSEDLSKRRIVRRARDVLVSGSTSTPTALNRLESPGRHDAIDLSRERLVERCIWERRAASRYESIRLTRGLVRDLASRRYTYYLVLECGAVGPRVHRDQSAIEWEHVHDISF